MLHHIRENKDKVVDSLLKRGVNEAVLSVDRLIELDQNHRKLIKETEDIKRELNQISSEFQGSNEKESLRKKTKELNSLLTTLLAEKEKIKLELDNLCLRFPNLIDSDVEENENLLVREWQRFGKPNTTNVEIEHSSFLEQNGVDFKRGIKLSGAGFPLYRGWAARKEWETLNWFIQTHINNGYEMFMPPLLVNEETGLVGGQLPKFNEAVFWTEDKKHFLLPTAEVALIGMFRDEIIPVNELPKKCFAFTPCFRNENIASGKGEKGTLRTHQFNKVELVQIVKPEDSEQALEEMLNYVCWLVEHFDLKYRVMKCSAKDTSFAMAKTYDVEVLIPSTGEYREVSSVSNAKDFQARRGNIKFKRANDSPTEYVHTLNASGLATSRLLPAFVEQL